MRNDALETVPECLNNLPLCWTVDLVLRRTLEGPVVSRMIGDASVRLDVQSLCNSMRYCLLHLFPHKTERTGNQWIATKRCYASEESEATPSFWTEHCLASKDQPPLASGSELLA